MREPIFPACLCCVFSLQRVLWGQVAAPPPSDHRSDDAAARVSQLEAETQALRARCSGCANTRFACPQATEASRPQRTPSPRRRRPASGGGRLFTSDELRGRDEEVRLEEGRLHHHPLRHSLGQHGLLDRAHARPAATRCTCSSASHGTRERMSSSTCRNTRLGFDVVGPQIPFFNCASSGGKVEIDFQNQRADRPRTSRPSCCGTPTSR